MNRRTLLLGLLGAPVAILVSPKAPSVPVSIGAGEGHPGRALLHESDALAYTKQCRHQLTDTPCQIWEVDLDTHVITRYTA